MPSALLLFLSACHPAEKPARDSADTGTGLDTRETGGDTQESPPGIGSRGDVTPVDADGDGYTPADGDCDDHDDDVHPGVRDLCGNEVDDDCDGRTDEVCGPRLSVEDVVTYTGEEDGDYAGNAMDGAGDVNGDGFDDLVIGALGNGEFGTGAVYLVLGSADPASGELADAIKFPGASIADLAGTGVAGAGDGDGDGFHDIVVGAPGRGLGGAVYLVRGSAAPTGTALGDTLEFDGASGDYAGISVGYGGDVDGDGLGDVMIGAYQSNAGSYLAGAAYILLGKDSRESAELEDAALRFVGSDAEYAGNAVSGAGDVDGDGLDDVLVGAYQADFGAGAAYLVLGADAGAGGRLTDSTRYQGEETGDAFGVGVSGAGDVDGDGHADFLIGATENDDGGVGSGSASLLLGGASPPVLEDAVRYIGGEGEGAGFVSGAGDLDADGLDDFVIAAWENDDDGHRGGAAYLVFGETAPSGGTLVLRPTIAGRADDHLGNPGYGGDVDGDGTPDLAIGALGQEDEGRGYLVLGTQLLDLAGR